VSARLLIVYNADAGVAAALFDMVHKIVSPATYPCSLCAVTYGVATMDRRWRAYLQALPLPVAFYHRQDFHAAFPQLASAPLPLIARDEGGAVTVLLDAAALAGLTTVDALMAALSARLA
jgi:hypothetical protein